MTGVLARRRQAATGGPHVDLRTRIGDVPLANPVMTASGTSGHGSELAAFVDLASLGAVVVKSVSAQPWAGNPAPRLHPVDGGMLNSVGLQNPGLTTWLAEELPPLAATGATVVASIWGFTAGQYGQAASALRAARQHRRPDRGADGDGRERGRAIDAVVAVEANISCPNIEDRRQMFAHSHEGIRQAVSAAVEGLAGSLPLWVKLSPNVTDLPSLAATAVEAGAAAVTLINTVMGLALDPTTGRPRLGGGGGGLSGPAIHPIAVRAVYECRAALPEVPIIGVGGVRAARRPRSCSWPAPTPSRSAPLPSRIPGLPSGCATSWSAWCARHGISTIEELRGRAV